MHVSFMSMIRASAPDTPEPIPPTDESTSTSTGFDVGQGSKDCECSYAVISPASADQKNAVTLAQMQQTMHWFGSTAL